MPLRRDDGSHDALSKDLDHHSARYPHPFTGVVGGWGLFIAAPNPFLIHPLMIPNHARPPVDGSVVRADRQKENETPTEESQ